MGSGTRTFPVILGVAGLLVSISGAGDWTQWRGPGRDGVADGLAAPKSWPATLTRIWSTKVGEGHANPVVVGQKIYMHTRENDQEMVRAVDLTDGRVLFSASWPVSFEPNPAALEHGKGPKSTPAVSADTLFTMGVTGTLVAVNLKDATVRWRKDFSADFKQTMPLYGAAASPLVDRGLVIQHVGGHHDGALTAFDVLSGEVRWSLKGDGPGYASPIIADLGGKRQLITQTDQRIISVNPDDGHLLWSLPFTTPYDQNAVTPLVAGNLLIISGIEQGLKAYALEPDGDKLKPREVWSRKEESLYMSSPVLSGGNLFGFSHMKYGHFVCINPKTGDVIWTSPGRDGANAALVSAGELVLALTEGADLLVLSSGAKEFAPLARFKVADSPTWSHPVVTSRGLLVKDKTTLSLRAWPL